MQPVLNRKSAEVRSRIEPDLKEQSVEILASLGLEISDAIRLFLRQVVAVHGLPFEVRKPNATTIAAIEEARLISRARFDSAESLFNELEKNTSKSKAGAPSKKGRLHAAVQ